MYKSAWGKMTNGQTPEAALSRRGASSYFSRAEFLIQKQNTKHKISTKKELYYPHIEYVSQNEHKTSEK